MPPFYKASKSCSPYSSQTPSATYSHLSSTAPLHWPSLQTTPATHSYSSRPSQGLYPHVVCLISQHHPPLGISQGYPPRCHWPTCPQQYMIITCKPLAFSSFPQLILNNNPLSLFLVTSFTYLGVISTSNLS